METAGDLSGDVTLGLLEDRMMFSCSTVAGWGPNVALGTLTG